MEEALCIAVLASGDFPIHRIPLQALQEASFIVCCDSAYRNLQASEFNDRDFVVVGDGDSLTDAEKQALGDRYIHIEEQDYNDLHKAMAYVASGKLRVESGKWNTQHSTRVSILGATGRREDHTLGNIAHLVEFLDEYPGMKVEMLTDHGRLTALRGQGRYESFAGQQVSLFSMTPQVPVSAEGLKWPLNQRCLTRWWQGTLNEALADHFTVSGGDVVVFQTYEPKR